MVDIKKMRILFMKIHIFYNLDLSGIYGCFFGSDCLEPALTYYLTLTKVTKGKDTRSKVVV